MTTSTNESRAAERQRKADMARAVTVAQPRRRKLRNGQTVPKATMGRTWHQFISPGRGSTGGAKADPNHPSRKHDVEVFPTVVVVEVTGPVAGQARRRDRRSEARKAVAA